MISNVTVAPLYADKILKQLEQLGCSASLLELPDGEQYKNLDVFNQVMNFLLEGSYARDVVIIALGGGVIGDLVGFASACYQRGGRLYSNTDHITIPSGLFGWWKNRG